MIGTAALPASVLTDAAEGLIVKVKLPAHWFKETAPVSAVLDVMKTVTFPDKPWVLITWNNPPAEDNDVYVCPDPTLILPES
jgi:hypothetical protein